MSESADGRLGTVLKGTYRLERLLGAGGMGAVYEASDSAGQRFAVKLVHEHLAGKAEHAARFLREARIGETVNSRHVVPVVDGGREDDGSLYLVMPLLDGYDAAGLLERVGPLPPDVAVRLMLQACEGLSAAHRLGVVHRDIKPSNLFLQLRADGEALLRIADFGVAKRADMYDDSNLTRTGASLGSPLYMSPEQVLNAKIVDERSDVYSLAATLYELLSGVTPHGDAITLGDLLVRITTRNAPSIQGRAPWLNPRLALALHQALHREPSGRFQTAEAFAGALRASGVVQGPAAVAARELRPLTDAERAVVAERADVDAIGPAEGSISGQVAGGAAEDPLIGRLLGGRYRVLRLLGRGGMGNVYEAQAAGTERVAVKVIAPEAAGRGHEVVRRFLREANASRTIDSRHVVRTLDVGTDDKTGLPFIVMELLRGVDLAVLLKRQGALSPAVIVRVLIQAARGVAAAHARGVIHRDVKPANLFLSVKPGDPTVTVKVCDFGVAKRLLDDESEQATRDLTRTGGMLGSPMYMSPEQAQSAKTVDHRTDIWSLGISLFEGLSARRPWDDRTTLGQIIVAICTAPVPSLQDLAPWIEPGLAEVTHQALAKDPELRLGTAADFISALEPFAGGTTEIQRDELRGVDLATRSRVAPRAPTEGDTTALAHSQTARADRTSTGRRTGFVALGMAFVVVAGIAVAGYRLQSGSVEPAQTAASVATATALMTTRVRVEPADALATVNGQPVAVVAGAIALTGEPGESFAVVIKKEGRARSVQVVLGRDGTASPSEVVMDLPTAPAIASSAPAPSVRELRSPRVGALAAAPPAKPAALAPPDVPTPNPVAPSPAAVPPSPPAVPAAPAKAGVAPVQDW